MTSSQQKITPHLWFDKGAREAAAFYASVFPESRVTGVTTLPGTPSGDTDIVSFRVWGQDFMAISAGPLFKFNPSVSFLVNFDPLFFASSSSPEQEARASLERAWGMLSEGGMALMPLDKYPFSERFGWIQDRYGLSWQLMLTNPAGDPRPAILPYLMFVSGNCGKAGEAIDFYLSVFKDSKLGSVMRHGPDQAPEKEGTIAFADFMLENQWFAALDSALDHPFNFNEAVSLMVYCDTQAEIDDYWEKLSAIPEAEQCGWLKDKFGLSWQVVPRDMGEMMQNGTPEQIERVTQAFLPMKKFDLAELQKAFDGR